jgi:hypothetical protein
MPFWETLMNKFLIGILFEVMLPVFFMLISQWQTTVPGGNTLINA